MNIIITGASGTIATETIQLLKGNHNLFLISTDPQKYYTRYNENSIKWFNLESFEKYAASSEIKFNIILHLGFTRTNDGNLIAQSLINTIKIAEIAKKFNITSFINISSQSVYGKIYLPLWKESLPPAPDYMYALGKYSSELIVNALLQGSNVNYTNIRLSSVCENARFLRIFVQNAISDMPIKVLGGKQLLSFIDVRDVALALDSIISKSDKIRFKEVYNLSTGRCNTILEMAEMVVKVGKEKFGLSPLIEIEDADINMKVGMDSTLFMSDFDWQPEYNLETMVESLYNFLYNIDLQKDISGGGIR